MKVLALFAILACSNVKGEGRISNEGHADTIRVIQEHGSTFSDADAAVAHASTGGTVKTIHVIHEHSGSSDSYSHVGDVHGGDHGHGGDNGNGGNHGHGVDHNHKGGEHIETIRIIKEQADHGHQYNHHHEHEHAHAHPNALDHEFVGHDHAHQHAHVHPNTVDHGHGGHVHAGNGKVQTIRIIQEQAGHGGFSGGNGNGHNHAHEHQHDTHAHDHAHATGDGHVETIRVIEEKNGHEHGHGDENIRSSPAGNVHVETIRIIQEHSDVGSQAHSGFNAGHSSTANDDQIVSAIAASNGHHEDGYRYSIHRVKK